MQVITDTIHLPNRIEFKRYNMLLLTGEIAERKEIPRKYRDLFLKVEHPAFMDKWTREYRLFPIQCDPSGHLFIDYKDHRVEISEIPEEALLEYDMAYDFCDSCDHPIDFGDLEFTLERPAVGEMIPKEEYEVYRCNRCWEFSYREV